MNLVECFVTKIIAGPHYKYGNWWLTVEYNTHGSNGTTQIMRKTNDFSDVTIGYKFLS